MNHSSEAILEVLVSRYGDDSNAALMARLSWLLEVLGDDESIETDWEPLRTRIERHYTLSEPVLSSVASHVNVRETAGGRIVYTFSRDEYIRRYGEAVPMRTLVLGEERDVFRIADGKWRLFVVSATDEFIVHKHAMDITELILNRNGDNLEVPLVHPTLVQDRGLEVKAAGEVAFTRTKRGSVGAVFNTKSGHFCPAPNTCETVVERLGELIGRSRIAAIPVRLRPSAGERI